MFQGENPHRLDLDATYCKKAKAAGVTIVINPDAHSTAGFADLEYGIGVARRGWLGPKDVFNTRKPAEIAKVLEDRKKGNRG